MNYETFKAAFLAGLREARIPVMGFTNEKLDLGNLDRTFEVYIEPVGGQDVEPFFVSAKLWWRWDALHTARTTTCQEDMLDMLFGGGEDAHEVETGKSAVRVDIEMQANLPWGEAMPMPSAAVWAPWVHEVMSRLEKSERVIPEQDTRETHDGRLEILAWQGEPSAKVLIAPGGGLKLEAVKVCAFQLVEVPRVFDDPEREDEPPYHQLREMFERVRAALHAWREGIDHLKPSELSS